VKVPCTENLLVFKAPVNQFWEKAFQEKLFSSIRFFINHAEYSDEAKAKFLLRELSIANNQVLGLIREHDNWESKASKEVVVND